jgi:hypothetical protein
LLALQSGVTRASAHVTTKLQKISFFQTWKQEAHSGFKNQKPVDFVIWNLYFSLMRCWLQFPEHKQLKSDTGFLCISVLVTKLNKTFDFRCWNVIKQF